MKILYVATLSNTVNTFLVPHIKMLVQQGHKVDIACNFKKPFDKKLKDLGCNFYNIPFQRKILSKRNIIAYKTLKELIGREEYDIVHTHTPIASAISRLVRKCYPEFKLIYTAHGFHFYKGAPVKNWILFYNVEKWLSKYTDCLITINSEDYNTALKNKFKAKKIIKIHGVGVDLTRFFSVSYEQKVKLRKKHNFKQNDFILIYPAELNKNKNQMLLIKSIGILKDKIPNIKLILAGTGNLFDFYKKKIEDMGLGNYIYLSGYRKDIDELIKLSDLSVASSIREGLGRNVIEGMACGLPVIALKNRGHNELIQDNKNGILVEKNSPNEFANAIYKLYKSQELHKEMSNNNLKIVNKFSVESVCKELEKVYTF